MNKVLIGSALAVVVAAGGAYLLNNTAVVSHEHADGSLHDHTADARSGVAAVESASTGFGVGQTATLYKAPGCTCCDGYANALRSAGFTVTVEATADLEQIKADHNIPSTERSCHTIEIGDYVVEGHVPLAAVQQLLTESSDIAGIGLPGMPAGTPGMPGRQLVPYEVYQLSVVGEVSPYTSI